MGRNVGELHQYKVRFTWRALRTKCHPSKEVICLQLAIVEWAQQPPYTIPYMQHYIGNCLRVEIGEHVRTCPTTN